MESGAKLELREARRATPALVAVYRGHLEVLKLLVARGAMLDLTSNDDAKPIQPVSCFPP